MQLFDICTIIIRHRTKAVQVFNLDRFSRSCLGYYYRILWSIVYVLNVLNVNTISINKDRKTILAPQRHLDFLVRNKLQPFSVRLRF